MCLVRISRFGFAIRLYLQKGLNRQTLQVSASRKLVKSLLSLIEQNAQICLMANLVTGAQRCYVLSLIYGIS